MYTSGDLRHECLHYDANGNETGITNPNGTTVTEVYDPANRLTSVTNENSSSTVLSSFSYGYNDDNQKTSVTEADGSEVEYTYDGMLHLSGETRTGTDPYTISYTVDGVGNRTSMTNGATTIDYTYDNDDELTSSTDGNSYGYNDDGDQTSRDVGGTDYTLAYDYENQLTSITQGTNVTSFTYDAEGRRVSREDPSSTTTDFLYDGDSVLLEEQGGTTTATYSYGTSLLRKDGEYPLFDALGSERTVTNSSQTVIGAINYDGFGNTVRTTGSSTDPYMFAATSGYRNDSDAGLILVGARYYDLAVGRFITRDTDLSQFPFVYCDADPINALDPSGHDLVINIGGDVHVHLIWWVWEIDAGVVASIGPSGSSGGMYGSVGSGHGPGLDIDGGGVVGVGFGTIGGFGGSGDTYGASGGIGDYPGAAGSHSPGYTGVNLSGGYWNWVEPVPYGNFNKHCAPLVNATGRKAALASVVIKQPRRGAKLPAPFRRAGRRSALRNIRTY